MLNCVESLPRENGNKIQGSITIIESDQIDPMSL
jgi:hypothetical protein